MLESTDKQSLALIIAAKATLRKAQQSRTWEERVQAIARMNTANKLAKASWTKKKS